MGKPTTTLATLRPDLGGSVEEIDLALDRQGFIGLDLMPPFETQLQAGPFGVIPREQLLQHPDTKRGPRGVYSRGDWKFETLTYATEENGREQTVDDREAAMYGNYFDAELIAAELARDAVLRAQEIRILNKALNETNHVPSEVDVDWADPTAKVVTDVKDYCIAFWRDTGMWPNAIAFSRELYKHLQLNEEIIDKVKRVQNVTPRDVNMGLMEAAFDLPRILVAGGTQRTNNPGQATGAFGTIFPVNRVVIARVAETRSIKEPCYGRTFHWGQDGSLIGAAMEMYRSEEVRGDVARARMDTDEKEITADLARLLSMPAPA